MSALRLVCIALPPKLSAIANISEESFAKLLDVAIERSQRPLKLIEAIPIEPAPAEQQYDASELKGPMSRLR
jgi:hypothetical protein